MIIKISISLLNNLINSIQNKNITNKQTFIFSKIIERLSDHGLICQSDINHVSFQQINDKFQGIIINDEKFIYFSQKLNYDGKPKSRNTFITQNFLPCFLYSSKYDLPCFLFLNPLDDIDKFKKITLPPSINFDLQLMKTIGINIGDEFGIIHQFLNVEDLVLCKNKIRSQNTYNRSSYIYIKNKNILIYGKVDGANKGKTILETIAISQINIKFHQYVVYFISIKEHLNENIKREIMKMNVHFFSESQNINNNEFLETNNKNNEINRNQIQFLKNIILKYEPYMNVDECFACQYNITENLISAHIYRVADIKQDYKNGKISDEIAKKYIVSGDNGFRLCPNHDKEFEKGMIFFDINSRSFKPFNSNKKELLTRYLKNKVINDSLVTSEFEQFIKKHIKRISSI